MAYMDRLSLVLYYKMGGSDGLARYSLDDAAKPDGHMMAPGLAP